MKSKQVCGKYQSIKCLNIYMITYAFLLMLKTLSTLYKILPEAYEL